MDDSNYRPGFVVKVLVTVLVVLFGPPIGPILFYGGVIWLLVVGHWVWAIVLFLVGSLITFIVTGLKDRVEAASSATAVSESQVQPNSARVNGPAQPDPVAIFIDARGEMLRQMRYCYTSLMPYTRILAAGSLLRRIDYYCTALRQPEFFSHPLNQTLAVGRSIMDDQQRFLSTLRR